MQRILGRLREVHAGKGVANPVAEQLKVLQEAVRALAAGENITPSASVVKAAAVGGVQLSARIKEGPRGRGGNQSWRITQGEEGRIFVGEGHVIYVEVYQLPKNPGPNDRPKKRWETGIVPTLDGTKLDAEEKPYFEPGEKTGAKVWLICQRQRCGVSQLENEEPERVELTDKNAKPPLESGEHATEIARFDLEEVEGSDYRVMKNLKYRLWDDWEMPYQCSGDQDDSDDSDLGSEEDEWESGSSGSGGSLDSGEDDEEDTGHCPGCKVKMSAEWLNKVDCFPANAEMAGVFPCSPGKFTMKLRVRFTGTDPHNKVCPHWAYGVSVSGAKTPEGKAEAVWIDDRTRELEFEFAQAPACQKVTVTWRARGYGPLKNPDGTMQISCCGCVYRDSIVSKTLPAVCNCGCSSEGDIDGDGIEDDGDDDVDGDGLRNDFDTDIDGDGTPNESDPDADGDGVPNDDDDVPLGPI